MRRILLTLLILMIPITLFAKEGSFSFFSQMNKAINGCEVNLFHQTIPLRIHKIQANPFQQGARPNKRAPTMKGNRLTQKLAQLQKNIRKQLTRYIQEIQSGSKSAILLSLLVSLFYGIIHAAGPGHRKIILFSYFSTHKQRVSSVFKAGFFSAGVHAASSILLTTVIFLIVKRAASTVSGKAASITELVTWLLIAFFGVALLIKTAVEHSRKKGIQCELKKSRNKMSGNLWLLTFITSLVPCPAASMIMMITLQQKTGWLGILLITSMSLGMGITISLAALPALASHRGLKRLSNRFGEKAGKAAEITLEIIGALILILIGLLMALPFIFQ